MITKKSKPGAKRGKAIPRKPRVLGLFGNGEDKPIHENLKEERKAGVRLNKKLRMISDHKHKLNIPWHLITDAVTSEGFVMPMIHGVDDNKQGRVHVQIGNKTWLVVQWYPFQNDTFEITAYAT
jgi:hypothetical protein